jgi:AsmA protein
MLAPTIAPMVGRANIRHLEPLPVTPTRGLKRLGLGLAALAAVGIAAFAAMPLVIRADAVREAVNAEIRFVTGLDPVWRGNAAVSLFPTGTATFSDVILSGEPVGSPALAAERLSVRLRFLPLLLGRIEVADVSLLRPKILISVDPAGRSNWSTLVSTLTRTLKPGGTSSERGMSFS